MEPTNILMLKLYIFFWKQFDIIPTCFDLSCLSSGGTEHQYSVHKKVSFNSEYEGPINLLKPSGLFTYQKV